MVTAVCFACFLFEIEMEFRHQIRMIWFDTWRQNSVEWRRQKYIKVKTLAGISTRDWLVFYFRNGYIDMGAIE